MRVYINGESTELTGAPSLAELITQLDLPATRVAVELNREVVCRGEWVSTMLHDDDRIEIVHFVGGGSSRKGAKAQRKMSGAGGRGPEQDLACS